MRRGLKNGAIALGLLLFVLFAYTPLLRTGLLARDAELLQTAGDTAALGDSAFLPLEGLSLQLSRKLFGTVEAGLGWEGGAFLVRLENLALLLVGALGLGWLTRRLLLPWCGEDQARAAARAAAAIFALHPLATTAVATLEARGDLLGLAMGLLSAAAFLKGRQDRRFGWTLVSFLLCAIGSFASDIAVVLPLFLAGFEFVSSHRYRPLTRRLRTSVTTLFAFGAAACLHSAFRTAVAGDAAPLLLREGIFANLAGLAGWGEQVGIAAEKLGLLVLPANVAVLGFVGPLLGGGIFLLAMQPALVAARSAPRLWGWLLVFWFFALFAAELVHAHVRVGGREIALAHVMLPSSAVMAVGLGIASTALTGPRRPYVSWGVLFIYAVLSFGNALPFREAAHEVALLRGDLMSAREAQPKSARMLVIDPPQAVKGVEPIGRSFDALLPDAGAGPTEIRGVRSEAFRLLLRQPEFDAWRGESMTLLLPTLTDGERAGERARERNGSARYEAFPFQRENPSAEPRTWRGLRSPILDLAPEFEALLEARTDPDLDREALGPLSWSSPSARPPVYLDPVWVRTTEGVSAFYDLAGSFEWLLRGRVRLMLFEEGQAQTENVLHAEVPSFASQEAGTGSIEPKVLGKDWVFDLPALDVLEPLEGAATYRLVLLDMASFESASYVLERSTDPENGERLFARRAADFVQRIAREGGGPLVWALQLEVSGVPLRMVQGRLES